MLLHETKMKAIEREVSSGTFMRLCVHIWIENNYTTFYSDTQTLKYFTEIKYCFTSFEYCRFKLSIIVSLV